MKNITDIQELKNIQLDILKYVDNFCQLHKITYFMCGGTLIGAVRHKGFIPWDDDIDIMMKRDDYERFIELFSKEKSYYKVYSHHIQKKYPHAYAKVADDRTVLLNNINGAIEMGVNIDVFPIDDLPDNEKIIKNLFEKSFSLNRKLSLKQIKISTNRSIIKNIILLIGRFIYSFTKVHKVIVSLNENATKYRGSNGMKCADLVAGFGYKEIQDRSNLSKAIKMKFEDTEFMAPIGYDKYLRGMYGDYMTLPPKEKRTSHHDFSAYWK